MGTLGPRQGQDPQGFTRRQLQKPLAAHSAVRGCFLGTTGPCHPSGPTWGHHDVTLKGFPFRGSGLWLGWGAEKQEARRASGQGREIPQYNLLPPACSASNEIK